MRATRKINCEEASRLISAGLDRELSPPARATLRLHQSVCAACKRFEQQMLLLRRALRGLSAGDVEAARGANEGGDGAKAGDAAGDAVAPAAPGGERRHAANDPPA